MIRPVTSRIGAGIAVASFVAIIAACGARGPLDDDPVLDASAAADVMAADVSTDLDASPPPVDARAEAASEGGTLIECGTCLVGQCGAGILTCVQATACRTTLQCVTTTCLAGGAPDTACLFKCASGDPTAALELFQIFQCVTGKCGGDCSSVLGGLLGGLGGGGGGDGGGGGGGGKARQPHPFARVLESRWPQLASH